MSRERMSISTKNVRTYFNVFNADFFQKTLFSGDRVVPLCARAKGKRSVMNESVSRGSVPESPMLLQA